MSVRRIPVVAGLAYRERLARLPEEFGGVLRAEPENPYNPSAIAVHASEGKVGYVAPEVARELYEWVVTSGDVPCVVTRGNFSPTTGLTAIAELKLDPQSSNRQS